MRGTQYPKRGAYLTVEVRGKVRHQVAGWVGARVVRDMCMAVMEGMGSGEGGHALIYKFESVIQLKGLLFRLSTRPLKFIISMRTL